MKVLKFSEDILSIFDIFPSFKVFKRTTNKCLKYLNPYVLFASQCVLIITSAGFVLRSSEDLSDWMIALVQAIMAPSIVGAFFCLVFQMDNIKRMHSQLQSMVDDGKLACKN